MGTFNSFASQIRVIQVKLDAKRRLPVRMCSLSQSHGSYKVEFNFVRQSEYVGCITLVDIDHFVCCIDDNTRNRSSSNCSNVIDENNAIIGSIEFLESNKNRRHHDRWRH